MKPKLQSIVGPHITTVLWFDNQLETMQSRAGQIAKELSSGAKLQRDHQVVALKKERTNRVSYLFIQS